MLLPIAGVFALRGMGLSGTLPWLSNSEHTAMLVGMLVFMLYRRKHYTSVYSFLGWPAASTRNRRSGGQVADTRQPSAPAGVG